MARLRLRFVVLVALAGLACAGGARAGTPLLVGVDDDWLKWANHPRPTLNLVEDLGVGAVRMTVSWDGKQTELTAGDRAPLDRAIPAAKSLRVVLAVYGRAVDAPLTAEARDRYCSFVGNVLHTYRSVHDVVIWNEPNAGRFWRPQFDAGKKPVAPAAYEALLAACYTKLHAARPDVNVIVATAPHGNDRPDLGPRASIAPGRWYRAMGGAYRGSHRTAPIFDTVGHNAYPDRSNEHPWQRHKGSSIDQGDYDKLMAALREGFGGTKQPVPGSAKVRIWYMEQGFQSVVPAAKAGSYTGVETDRFALPAAPPFQTPGTQPSPFEPATDQATQLFHAVQLASCQPAVGAIFNFELVDETLLGGWQSGLLWADWTPKPAYYALKQAIASVRAGKVDCAFYAAAADRT